MQLHPYSDIFPTNRCGLFASTILLIIIYRTGKFPSHLAVYEAIEGTYQYTQAQLNILPCLANTKYYNTKASKRLHYNVAKYLTLLSFHFISFHFIINLTTTMTICRSVDSDKWNAGWMLKDIHHFSGDTWKGFMIKVDLRDQYGCGIWEEEEQGQIWWKVQGLSGSKVTRKWFQRSLRMCFLMLRTESEKSIYDTIMSSTEGLFC